MSNPIAVYSGAAVLYWSAIIITLGLLAALMMSLSLQRSNGGRAFVMLLFFPLMLLFSLPLARLVHWYCHAEQYGSLSAAMTDFGTGSFVLPAALLGCWLAAFLASRLDDRRSARLLDAFAPGAALAVAFIRLSALFNSSSRSKIPVTKPFLQHLPLASGVPNSAGQLEYRFATFFVEFLMMLLLCWLLLRFFYRRRSLPMKSGSREGNVARMFLLGYSACELLMDSTRYDSSFVPFNGFISIVQMVAAFVILGVLIYYSVHSVRANGLRFSHGLRWIGWLVTLAGVGVSEYLVQRHGDWYLPCYGVMAISCLLMALIVYRMYLSCCAEPREE